MPGAAQSVERMCAWKEQNLWSEASPGACVLEGLEAGSCNYLPLGLFICLGNDSLLTELWK